MAGLGYGYGSSMGGLAGGMMPPNINMNQFNKGDYIRIFNGELVIDEAAKEEIISVLKQFKHKEKLFEEWGLGEVIQYGKGMTFLFYGPPGTGKTWAANLIAQCSG